MQRWVFGQKITTSEDIISCDSRKRVLIQRKIANHLFTRLINKWPLCLGLKKLLTTINCCLITSISPFLVKLSSRRIHVCIDFFQKGNQTFFDFAHFTNTGNTKTTLIPGSTSNFVKQWKQRLTTVTDWKSPDAQFEPKQPNQRHGSDGDRNPLIFENASHNRVDNKPVNLLNPRSATPTCNRVHNWKLCK